MSVHRLEYLCAGFCEIANLAVPELRQQDDGIVAFNVNWRGVAVDVMAKPSPNADHAFVLFDLGVPDSARADPLRVLLALMHANFASLRANQPVFSCHPQTNTVVLQWSMALAHTTPAHLLHVIQEGAALANQWREDYFLSGAGTHDAAGLPPGEYA
jgi:hypothetical protein